MTWLTNHHPSVLRHCWLGLTRKIISEMTFIFSIDLSPPHWLVQFQPMGRAKVDRKDNCTIDNIAPAVLSDSCKHAIFVPMRKKCGTDFRNSDYKIGNFFPAVELSMPTGLSSLSSCVFVANGGTSWHVCSSACVFLHVGIFFFSFACH